MEQLGADFFGSGGGGARAAVQPGLVQCGHGVRAGEAGLE